MLSTQANGAKFGPRGSVEAPPARVLAECEAKRRIVGLHQTDTTPGVGGIPRSYCGGCGTDEYPGPFPCDTLRLLALPYADHADYRDEWKP